MSYPTLFATPGVKAFAEAVDTERQAQLAKWGDQHHPDGTGISDAQRKLADDARAVCQQVFAEGKGDWAHILMEEIREAFAESDPAKLRAELIQSAAVIAAWITDLDSRPTA
jgi:hypothetical protein